MYREDGMQLTRLSYTQFRELGKYRMNMHLIGESIKHSNQETVTFSISPRRPGTRLFHIFCFAHVGNKRGHYGNKLVSSPKPR